MKKKIQENIYEEKEGLWALIKRLDEQAGQFNLYIAEANRYFDNTAEMTKILLDRHERDFNKLLEKVKSSLKLLGSKSEKNQK